MKRLTIFIIFFVFIGCKKSDDGTVKVIPLPLPPNTVYGANNRIWMDRNLGASQVATSSIDVASYGDLYQWGRAADGHQKRTSGTTKTLSSTDSPSNALFIIGSADWRIVVNDNLWQGVNGVNNPCPVGSRLPTYAEWVTEMASWSSKNASGAFASPLKLPMAGLRDYGNGSIWSVDNIGYYWNSTISSTFPQYLYFNNSTALLSTHYRTGGFSCRCIKD